LSRGLLALALGAPGSAPVTAALGALGDADERAWQVCLERLLEHQLLPVIWSGLLRHDCAEQVPEKVRARLQQHFERAQVVNQLSLEALRRIAEAAALEGVTATACKGIVLAPEYYPSLAARPMNDVDLWILPQQRAVLGETMRRHGFVRNEEKSNSGADYYESAMGIVFDVHVEMELFAAHADALMTLTRPSSDGPWRVFEPHALLTHLVVHMSGHATEMGPMIMWMIDLWFVLRKVGRELDLARLRRLLPSTAEWVMLRRAVRMLELVAGEELSAELGDVAPFELNAIWRERRLATWDLPRPRGWARLVACRLGLRDPKNRYYPSWSDLARWPFDHAMSSSQKLK
jgi:hypothetical protein